MNKQLLTGFLTLLSILIIVSISFILLNSFKNNNRLIAQQSVKSASSEISRKISDIKHQLKLFAEEKRELLLELSSGNVSENSYQQLTQLLSKHFPDYFAATLTSHEGKSLLRGYDSLVGNGCRRDIKKFVGKLEKHGVYMHSSPQNGPHHFDIMVPFIQADDSDGVFFVSFKGQLLASILKSIEVSGHNLYVVREVRNKEKAINADHLNHEHGNYHQYKIEAASQGPRDILSRDLLLTEDEVDSIQSVAMPEGTIWKVIDVADGKLHGHYFRQILIMSIAVELVFLLLIYFIYRQFNKIIFAEKQKEQEVAERKIAQQSNLSKSEFLANMSHEIRTPLNGILGVTQLLDDTKLTNEQESYIKTLRHSSKSLLTILNDILDYSKIESGKLEIEYLNLNLNDELNEIEKLISSKAKEKGIQFSVKKLEQDLYLQCDPVRLSQILLNLSSNAIKFTDKGEVQLNISLIDENDLQANVQFQVIDTGIGISEDKLSHIFDKFTQADTSTTREFGGTGLGLAISKQLIELMDGSISVSSKLGEGSTFTFNLPLKKGTVPQPTHTTSLDKKLSLSGKILLVDDNHTNRMIAKKLLEKNGLEVITAENGVEAIYIFQQNKFDIVLMDMQMPVMGGVEATQEILKMFPETSTPIVAMTANAMEEHKQECFDVGMTDFITKPVNFETIKGILLKYLKDNS